MEKKYRIVPFDIEKAKAGAEVVTAKDNLKVEILKYCFKCDYKSKFPILAIINFNNGLQAVYTYDPNGKLFTSDEHDFDLRIREEIKYKRMTYQELAWWLHECPKEHREWKYRTGTFINGNFFSYTVDDANIECVDILIRSNGGEWKEPLIEEL